MKKYLITSDDVKLIYDIIKLAIPQTMKARVQQLDLMEQFRDRLDETEISPWTEEIHPWSEGGEK